MTTIHIAHTVPLNAPSSTAKPLTSSHLWRALEQRTHHPERFSSIITSSIITSTTTRAADGATVLARRATYAPGTGPAAAQMAGGELAETCALLPEARVDVTTDYGGGGVAYIVSSMAGSGDDKAPLPLLTALYHFRHPELSAAKDRPAIAFLRQRYDGLVRNALDEFVTQVCEMGAAGQLEGDEEAQATALDKGKGVAVDDALNAAAAAATEARTAPQWPPLPPGAT